MSLEITWLGHGSWLIKIAETHVLLDPFITDNPGATCNADDLDADFILVSHGHFDHVGDVAAIANRTGATVVANFEIAQWFQQQQAVAQTIGMNIGGGVNLPFGRLVMTPALHSSQLPDGSYGGNPGGFLIEAHGKRVYFACDTGLFSDMQLIGKQGLDLAVLPIGDLFTMGPEDSVSATKLLSPQRVVPAHFNTWPPIEQDSAAWAKMIKAETQSTPILLEVSETLQI